MRNPAAEAWRNHCNKVAAQSQRRAVRRFAAGNRVRCVDDTGVTGIVKRGMRGTVAASPYDEADGFDMYVMIQIDGDTVVRGWMDYRWELITNEMPDTRDYLNALSDGIGR